MKRNENYQSKLILTCLQAATELQKVYDNNILDVNKMTEEILDFRIKIFSVEDEIEIERIGELQLKSFCDIDFQVSAEDTTISDYYENYKQYFQEKFEIILPSKQFENYSEPSFHIASDGTISLYIAHDLTKNYLYMESIEVNTELKTELLNHIQYIISRIKSSAEILTVNDFNLI